MTKSQTNLYSQVVSITSLYLGPAAERFVSRQIQTHLEKDPEDLTAKDLEKLVDWIRISIALLTEDARVVEEFSARLLALTQAQVDG